MPVQLKSRGAPGVGWMHVDDRKCCSGCTSGRGGAGADQEQTWCQILEIEPVFGLGVRGIEGRHHRTESGERQQELDDLGAVRKHDRHPIAAADPRGPQSRCELGTHGQELFVGHDRRVIGADDRCVSALLVDQSQQGLSGVPGESQGRRVVDGGKIEMIGSRSNGRTSRDNRTTQDSVHERRKGSQSRLSTGRR